MRLGEPRLVAIAIDGADAGLPAATALPGDDDGVADAPVGQPAGAAVVEAVVPGRVQLGRGGQLRPMALAVGLGLP